jgi:hypothetical protein
MIYWPNKSLQATAAPLAVSDGFGKFAVPGFCGTAFPAAVPEL